MTLEFGFLFTNILLGVGLAMDAFSVSLANGLHEPNMRIRKGIGIAGTFAFFQALMPLIGWVCVHTLSNIFKEFQKFIPWIALMLLVVIGISLIKEGVSGEEESPALGIKALMVQGIATSIDALSVGFTIAEYKLLEAIIAAFIIAIVTFIICAVGVATGK
ncbi:MAG: manganese efflux pump, partial [Lachnospiraceae bacterium]|nr:manganese efflux pump [Lachnospiraceae bacterium]